MTIVKVTKKQVPLDAMQYTGANLGEIMVFCPALFVDREGVILCDSDIGGISALQRNNWIVKMPGDHFQQFSEVHFASNFVPLEFESPQAWGCHCDLDEGQEPDGCVLDENRPQDCVYANRGGNKKDCKYWLPFSPI